MKQNIKKVTSNKVINLNKIRAACMSQNPEAMVMVFYYNAPTSEQQYNQRPLVRVIENSLRKLKNGDWAFNAINLYRVNLRSSGIRTYVLSRINGIVTRL